MNNSRLLLLKKLKERSDAGDYKTKHRMARMLISAHPEEYYVDSVEKDVIGITHEPTKFRFHIPKAEIYDFLPSNYMDAASKNQKNAEQIADMFKTAGDEWIGVDLDGTLAEYGEFEGPTKIGEPVEKMVSRVKKWLDRGKTVKILTARVAGEDADAAEKAIRKWCKTHIGQELEVTNEKDHLMKEVWDDRAVQVVQNEGDRVDSKQGPDMDEGYSRISFDVKGDAVRSLAELLEDIRRTGAPGHSFSIQVDENGSSYGFDGDGADYIESDSIRIDGKKVKFQKGDGRVCAEKIAAFIAYTRKKTAGTLTDAIKRVDRNPTTPQQIAGNYRHGHFRFQGLPISMENPKGSIRKGKGPTPWKVTMPAHYGYILGTMGKDGDHLDVYIGPNKDSNKVFIVDQLDIETSPRAFDEHKCMLGFSNLSEAMATYRRGFSDGKGKDRCGRITEITMDAFKGWIYSRKTKKPFAWQQKKAVLQTSGEMDRRLLSIAFVVNQLIH